VEHINPTRLTCRRCTDCRGALISRHRIRLGSGLDQRKLADTIMQLTRTGKGTAVVCDVHGQLESWVHLAWRHPSEGDDAEWNMSFGFPLNNNHVEDALAKRGIILPEGSRVASWTGSIYAAIVLPEHISPAQLAELIEHIMVRLQGVVNRFDVEVALEME
jgi:hypothetical protein